MAEEAPANPTAAIGDPAAADEGAKPSDRLDQGTYDVLRNRLASHAAELRKRLDALNAARKGVFGAIDTKLLSTDRVITEHNCVPRDMVSIGDRFLFGYNVQFGLKSETNVGDVFAFFRFDGAAFHPEPLGLLKDERFEKDFRDLYRYYKGARFARFLQRGSHLYMKFHVGKTPDDFKAFKWLVHASGDQAARLEYVDARSEADLRYPPQHEFEWKRATRDLVRGGAHPHVSVEDKVFVETIGGDLTIKVEDNTATGEGIYAEPVENPDQTLDDAEFFYAVLGHLVLLKVRPYQEKAYRYFVFNDKLKEVVRLDAIAQSCVMLPDDHGLIFPNGYYLASGERTVFPHDGGGMIFDRRIASPNGEDTLFVFYHRESGAYALLSYNLIEQRVETPILCNGFSLFADGKLVYFKGPPGGEPQKHHALQVWQTPYVGPNYVPDRKSDSLLFKIGNRDIVRAMAECAALLKLVAKDEAYAEVYLDIVRAATDVLESYFWLAESEASDLAEPLRGIKAAAQAAVGEFEKVTRVRKATRDRVAEVTKRARELITANATRVYEDIHGYVKALSGLRETRGEIIGLRELRYVDRAAVDALEADVAAQGEEISRRTVAYLLKPESLDPYRVTAAGFGDRVDGLSKGTDAKELEERIGQASRELEMLIDVVGNLKIDDATQRTTIVDAISAIFGILNAARSRLKSKSQELAKVEGAAEFSSQLKLLNQSVVNYLDIADTPAKTDELLTRLMVQVEELEGKFAEFDDYVLQLTEKRQEVYNAFESRKLALVEARNRRASALAQAAERVLSGVKSRVAGFGTIAEINGYFASDLMIDKVRGIVDELARLGDTVKVDDIQSRLKTVREDAVRQLKDRAELFEDGAPGSAPGSVIRLGRHKFSVNTQPMDLTMVLRDGVMHLHLAGTGFFEPITDPAFLGTRDAWSQEVVSETPEVYRAEWLAYVMFGSADMPAEAGTPGRDALRALDDAQLLDAVQRFMAPRYAEGYIKGVHDADAAVLLRTLLELDATIGLLRYASAARAVAQLFWRSFDGPERDELAAQLQGFARVARAFPNGGKQGRYTAELRSRLAAFVAEHGHFDAELLDDAAAYLFAELTSDHAGFAISPDAVRLVGAFEGHLQTTDQRRSYDESMERVRGDAWNVFLLARDWLAAFRDAAGDGGDAWSGYLDEAALLLVDGQIDVARVVQASVTREVTGLVGTHPRIDGGRMRLDFNEFVRRMHRHAMATVPRFDAYAKLKREVLDRAVAEMRLDEFKPKVLTSFVRNRLIDEVYLPLVGDNLAKQIGATGEGKRTDRQGLLLVISPPGYGKTTLLEYVANRLGLVFMKINGPAIGHAVTSLDPAEAPNAAAREEIQRLNLALEMGDNVLIMLDDIQHTNPEFLQKFISLCDAQRKIEGVYKGRTRTYDLRGRKVAVVMAGNPYTESGGKFQIPDMLANRADTYNLGDILGDHARAFQLSYLENCVTSNPVLNKLAARAPKDVHGIIAIAEAPGGSREGVELEGNWSTEEVGEMVEVMRKLLRVRDVILRVNEQYIASAGQEDQYRTEPPFLLQGSYRNMNRIAEKVVPVMNDAELQTLIVSAYEQDAQTLTRGAEANLLKFKELIGILTAEERARWDEIKRTFARNNSVKSLGGDDKTAAVLSQLAGFNQHLGDIRGAIQAAAHATLPTNGDGNGAAKPQAAELRLDAAAVEALQGLAARLAEAIATTATGKAKATADGNGAHHTPTAPPQQIHVVNKVPSTFLYVMKEQFELMKRWLEPMTRLTAQQDGELAEVRAAIERLNERYDQTIQRLERSQLVDPDDAG